MNLNLTTDENKSVVKLLTDDEGDEIEDEIKAKVVVLAMNLKRKKITEQPVKIHFYTGTTWMFSLYVDTSQTVDQLIQQVQTERRVFIFFLFS